MDASRGFHVIEPSMHQLKPEGYNSWMMLDFNLIGRARKIKIGTTQCYQHKKGENVSDELCQIKVARYEPLNRSNLKIHSLR
jgi:hypothetical protein